MRECQVKPIPWSVKTQTALTNSTQGKDKCFDPKSPLFDCPCNLLQSWPWEVSSSCEPHIPLNARLAELFTDIAFSIENPAINENVMSQSNIFNKHHGWTDFIIQSIEGKMLKAAQQGIWPIPKPVEGFGMWRPNFLDGRRSLSNVKWTHYIISQVTEFPSVWGVGGLD